MTALPLPVAVPGDLTLLDEDWAVPCEVGRAMQKAREKGDCSQAAEWVAYAVRCCPDRTASVLMCTGHHAMLMADGMPGVCSHCDEVYFPARLGFRLIEPLNRRTT